MATIRPSGAQDKPVLACACTDDASREMVRKIDRGSAHDAPATEPPDERKNKGGRPRRDADGDSLEKLTIRLTPKLKLGLDLLARAQHRSLSQAVEWALQVGLNNYEVGTLSGAMDSIGTILDKAWPLEEEGARVWKIYNLAPSLLTFEEAKACELIEKSYERQLAVDYVSETLKGSNFDADDFQNARDQESVMFETFYRFAALTWPAIKEIATERANAGKSMSGVFLLKALGLDASAIPEETYRIIDEMVAAYSSDDPKKAIRDLLDERLAALQAIKDDKQKKAEEEREHLMKERDRLVGELSGKEPKPSEQDAPPR